MPAMLQHLVEAGADIIELGVPFSDPMADGPVIQRASERALARGVCLADVLDLVRAFRARDTTTPIVLMGYANPIEAMGETAFADRARDAGVDGVLVVDYPPEEAADFAGLLNARGIAPIFLLAPTTPTARIEAVARLARGYVYYVSLKGVTGAAHSIPRRSRASSPRSAAMWRCRSVWASASATPRARARSPCTPTRSSSAAASSRRSSKARRTAQPRARVRGSPASAARWTRWSENAPHDPRRAIFGMTA
jgi:hypothetical protein